MRKIIFLAFAVLISACFTACNSDSVQSNKTVLNSSDTTVITTSEAFADENNSDSSIKTIEQITTKKQKSADDTTTSIVADKHTTTSLQENTTDKNTTNESQVTVAEPPSTTDEISETSTVQKEIDIDYYINFATNYAENIGLMIDNSAMDCWDNPISVTSKTSNVKKSITDRLDRYKNIEGFSSVCIWYEEVSDNSFEIYIGYA